MKIVIALTLLFVAIAYAAVSQPNVTHMTLNNQNVPKNPAANVPPLEDPTTRMMPPDNMPNFRFEEPKDAQNVQNQPSSFGNPNDYKIEYKPMNMNEGLEMDKNESPSANLDDIRSRLPASSNIARNPNEINRNLPLSSNINTAQMNPPNVNNPNINNNNNMNANPKNPNDSSNNVNSNFRYMDPTKPIAPNPNFNSNLNPNLPNTQGSMTDNINRRIKHIRLNNNNVNAQSANATGNQTNSSGVPTEVVDRSPIATQSIGYGPSRGYGNFGGLNTGFGSNNFGSNLFGSNAFGSNSFGSGYGSGYGNSYGGVGSNSFGSGFGGLNSGFGSFGGSGFGSGYGSRSSNYNSGYGSNSGFGDSYGSGYGSGYGGGYEDGGYGGWKKR